MHAICCALWRSRPATSELAISEMQYYTVLIPCSIPRKKNGADNTGMLFTVLGGFVPEVAPFTALSVWCAFVAGDICPTW